MDKGRRSCVVERNVASVHLVVEVPEFVLRIIHVFSSGFLCVRLCCTHKYRRHDY